MKTRLTKEQKAAALALAEVIVGMHDGISDPDVSDEVAFGPQWVKAQSKLLSRAMKSVGKTLKSSRRAKAAFKRRMGNGGFERFMRMLIETAAMSEIKVDVKMQGPEPMPNAPGDPSLN